MLSDHKHLAGCRDYWLAFLNQVTNSEARSYILDVSVGENSPMFGGFSAIEFLDWKGWNWFGESFPINMLLICFVQQNFHLENTRIGIQSFFEKKLRQKKTCCSNFHEHIFAYVSEDYKKKSYRFFLENFISLESSETDAKKI